MKNWKEIITIHREEVEEALMQAMRTAIECGKIDAVKGQAFAAENEVLLYEDGHVEIVRHPGGVTLGDVHAGKAIRIAKITDWTADSFVLDDNEDPEAIDVDELLADYYPENNVDALLHDMGDMGD